MPEHLTLRRDNGRIWSPLRQAWLIETPEEAVRQSYLPVLVNEYGFAPEQIEEELEVTGRGAGHARADFVIWRSPKDKLDGNNPLIVVECKSDNVTIRPHDYWQGDNYARLTGARFFVTHNSRETKYWRVLHQRMPKSLEEIANIPHADASEKEIEQLIAQLKVFKEDEFADLLHSCHNIIRNREKLDPAAAFDEIAKILFVKVFVERELRAKRTRKNLFTVDFLDAQLGRHPLNTLFEQTKDAYEDDHIFEKDEEIRLKPATGHEIVKSLERYNLSDTSEDIKGIAFERFLGRTFRGEIGQFFTPRTIVEFMVGMLEPKEGDIICDPASGSGGFLIRFFEIVRQQILADADAQYQAFKARLEKVRKLTIPQRAKRLRDKYAEIQATLDPAKRDSRLWRLANRCIYGTDANDRMARTSKMNMIMHGDGHGGVHHHDGFINVNGIFEGRFDLVLTNPPFGANVEASDVIHDSDVEVGRAAERRYREEYGDLYDDAMRRVRAAVGKPISSLFELPKNVDSKTKTEILFMERCISLLKPGGRLGIVLPEGIFNNPSLAYVREFCEDRVFIRAVVSLPQETFYSSGASVKASLLFVQKFTKKEQVDFDNKYAKTIAEVRKKYASEIKQKESSLLGQIKKLTAATSSKELSKLQRQTVSLTKRLGRKLPALSERQRRRFNRQLVETRQSLNFGRSGKTREQKHKLVQKLQAYRSEMAQKIAAESRELLKERFPYPVFLYAADKVGITATGDADQNELSPNDNAPPNTAKTALELYREFRTNPDSFFLAKAVQ